MIAKAELNAAYHVGLYVDDGSQFQTLLREVAREMNHETARLIPLMAEDVSDSNLARLDCFVMPGGADLPYCERLNGTRNNAVRAFVENGGSYLGVCAGAYYGCRSISFNEGRADAIVEPRELGLVEAVATGSLTDLAPPYDLRIGTAAATLIEMDDIGRFRAYYHGGPKFELAPEADVDVFARYAEVGGAPAGVSGSVGQGRVVLSGVHLEISADTLSHELAQLDNGDQHRHLVNALEETAPMRLQAFRALLTRAGIPLKAPN